MIGSTDNRVIQEQIIAFQRARITELEDCLAKLREYIASESELHSQISRENLSELIRVGQECARLNAELEAKQIIINEALRIFDNTWLNGSSVMFPWGDAKEWCAKLKPEAERR